MASIYDFVTYAVAGCHISSSLCKNPDRLYCVVWYLIRRAIDNQPVR